MSSQLTVNEIDNSNQFQSQHQAHEPSSLIPAESSDQDQHIKSSRRDSDSMTKQLAVQWNAKLDASLMQLVQKLGNNSWEKVAAGLGLASGQQCNDRWKDIGSNVTVYESQMSRKRAGSGSKTNNTTRADNSSPAFTQEDESGSLTLIGQPIPQDLRNISLQQQYQVQGGQKGTWSEEEDQKLLNLVQAHGAKGWNYIASQLPGRAGKQCRERYHNHLDPKIVKEKWTLEEDKNLMQLYQRFGKKWSMIARHMPGRTDNTIKNRFNSALRMHTSFQDYLDYKQKKYEKSLKRKSKGIYKKKNEDEITMMSKKMNIARQNERLRLMKSLAHNAKNQKQASRGLEELAIQEETSNSKVSKDGDRLSQLQESKEFDQEEFNSQIEIDQSRVPKDYQRSNFGKNLTASGLSWPQSGSDGIKGMRLHPCDQAVGVANAEKHTSSSSDIAQPNSSMASGSVYDLERSGRSSIRHLVPGQELSEKTNNNSLDLHCQEESLHIAQQATEDNLQQNKLEGINRLQKAKVFSQLAPSQPDKLAKKQELTDQQMRCTKDSSKRSSLPVMKNDLNAQKKTKELIKQNSCKSSVNDQRSKHSLSVSEAQQRLRKKRGRPMGQQQNFDKMVEANRKRIRRNSAISQLSLSKTSSLTSSHLSAKPVYMRLSISRLRVIALNGCQNLYCMPKVSISSTITLNADECLRNLMN